MRKTVVFILSSNFSGSHFLSLLLGSHSKAAHLGEVKNLVKIKNLGQKSSHNSESSRQCYVCEEKPECIITSRLHGLQKGDIYSTLFSRHAPSITHLIDASKKSEWANNFISNPDFNIKFIHLIRDPRALVRKWDLHYNAPSDLTRQKVKQIRNFPSKLMKILWFPSWQTYLLKWLDQNRTIFNFIMSSGHDYQTISYEELATDAEKTLGPLMAWLELDFEPAQINYWEHEHHGTQKQKYNTNTENNKKFIDTRWKTEIPNHVQKSITRSSDLQSFISELGYSCTDNGLFKTHGCPNS